MNNQSEISYIMLKNLKLTLSIKLLMNSITLIYILSTIFTIYMKLLIHIIIILHYFIERPLLNAEIALFARSASKALFSFLSSDTKYLNLSKITLPCILGSSPVP